MVLLRRVIGDALRSRRLDQDRTLRDVSTAANVSLGYLSEIERGQKEASSELLASICEALDVRLSEVLREASGTMALAEEMAEMMKSNGESAESASEASASAPAEPEAKLSTPIELTIEPPAKDQRGSSRPDVVVAA